MFPSGLAQTDSEEHFDFYKGYNEKILTRVIAQIWLKWYSDLKIVSYLEYPSPIQILFSAFFEYWTKVQVFFCIVPTCAEQDLADLDWDVSYTK